MEPTTLDWTILQQEPVDFIEIAFGDDLWQKQIDIANSVRDNTYTAVKSCHAIGKSRISADISQWFLHAFPESKVITTAPTFRQVEDILWQEIRAVRKKAKVFLGGNTTQTRIDISENWFALGLSTDDPDRFVGYHAPYLLVIIDEAAGVDEKIFEAIEGVVSSGFVRVLYIGNPTSTAGTFYNAFRMANVSKISISAFDTPNFTHFGITIEDIRNNTWEQKITAELPRPYLITPSWVYDKYLRWGEGSPAWDARIMGKFPEQGEDTLIPLAAIERARVNKLEVKDSDPEQTGVDIARFGTDKTIFIHRKGPRAIETKEYFHNDTMVTSQNLHLFIGFHPAAATYVDVVGVGAGVFDRIKQLNDKKEDIYGINVGESPQDPERFFNLRAEIFWNLRERFVNNDIDLTEIPQPLYEDLSAELANIKFKFTPKGQIQLESKDDMKKRGLPSPDKADALALAFGNFKSKSNLLEFLKG